MGKGNDGIGEVFGAMLRSMSGGGGDAVKWNGGRKMIHFMGDMYVIIGIAYGGELEDSPKGMFVIPRRDYAAKRPVPLTFIPGEFLIEVYPADRKSGAQSAIQQAGCAADEEMNDVAVDVAIMIAEKTYSEEPHVARSFESFRKEGYRFPVLSDIAKVYLDIDQNLPALEALMGAITAGESLEEADKKAKAAARKALKRRLAIYGDGKPSEGDDDGEED